MVRNVLYGESINKADKLNALFRNKSFNFLELVLRLFEPYFTTNVLYGLIKDNIGLFGPSILEFMASIADTPLFKSVLNSSYHTVISMFKSLNSIDLISDEHLWQRGFYRHVTDNNERSIPIVGAPWRMSVTPAAVAHAAPLLGEQNDYVLGTLLGLSAEERRRLVANKIVY